MTEHISNWNNRYIENDTPWDSGLASKQLGIILERYNIQPGRVLDLGCGTGTNSIYLAQKRFEVTAVDCSSEAIDIAKAKAEKEVSKSSLLKLTSVSGNQIWNRLI